jgi:hypothetical protein
MVGSARSLVATEGGCVVLDAPTDEGPDSHLSDPSEVVAHRDEDEARCTPYSGCCFFNSED